MNKWFAGVTTIEELRKRYRELLKQLHPDNGGDEETMKAINIEYDKLFDVLNLPRRKRRGRGTTENFHVITRERYPLMI